MCVCLSFFQLVKGIRYTITVELSNTQCKKSAMLRTCDFYPEAHKLKVGCVCVRERERLSKGEKVGHCHGLQSSLRSMQCTKMGM